MPYKSFHILQTPGITCTRPGTSHPPTTKPTLWSCTQPAFTASACTPTTRLAAAFRAKSSQSVLKKRVSDYDSLLLCPSHFFSEWNGAMFINSDTCIWHLPSTAPDGPPMDVILQPMTSQSIRVTWRVNSPLLFLNCNGCYYTAGISDKNPTKLTQSANRRLRLSAYMCLMLSMNEP